MKNLILLLCTPIIIWSCVEEGAATSNEARAMNSAEASDSAFPSEQGKITYTLAGTLNGDETWYWSDWGKKQRRETNTVMEMMGIRKADNKVNLNIEGKSYNLNEKAKTATAISSDLGDAMADMDYSSEEALTQFGAVKDGTEDVIGKTCQIWKMESLMSRVWVWKGLPMRSETDMGIVQTSTIATSVDLDPNLDEDLFDVSGYEIKDMGRVEDYMPKR